MHSARLCSTHGVPVTNRRILDVTLQIDPELLGSALHHQVCPLRPSTL